MSFRKPDCVVPSIYNSLNLFIDLQNISKFSFNKIIGKTKSLILRSLKTDKKVDE